MVQYTNSLQNETNSQKVKHRWEFQEMIFNKSESQGNLPLHPLNLKLQQKEEKNQ